MHEQNFQEKLAAYENWKDDLIDTIETFQAWLEESGLGGDVTDMPICEAVEALRNDRLTLAFVAEFSRGKSELINAIFFADQQRRLLPSDAGRTTMCPTELFYDREAGSAYLRLLPIETRAGDTRIAEYRKDPAQWTCIDLDTNNPDRLAANLMELTRLKQVTIEEAKRLGMYVPAPEDTRQGNGMVMIPCWRHALISYPHPLLKQGLVILDTPGLNALGSEPELTLNMLPAAQAVLFVLAADTGVTRSDMEMWQHHIKASRGHNPDGVLIALNKIDTLWDELKEAADIEKSIAAQRTAVAERLDVDTSRIFTVSAQKGLLAKIRGDQALLERSGLDILESYLSEDIVPARQGIVHDTILSVIDAQFNDAREILTARLEQMNKQLGELISLRGKNADVIMQLMAKTRSEQTAYLKSVDSFQTSRRQLSQQAQQVLASLSLEKLDDLITQTREQMVDCWTTLGMKHGMKTFFIGVRSYMQDALRHSEQTRKHIEATYAHFHDEHGLPAITPKALPLKQYYIELDRLYDDAEEFRNSPVTAMTEQVYVIRKFFINLVSRVRDLFLQANEEAENWLAEVMNPLLGQIKEHKAVMEKRLDTLRRISESRDNLEGKIRELEAQLGVVQEQLSELMLMHAALQRPLPEPLQAGLNADRLPQRAANH